MTLTRREIKIDPSTLRKVGKAKVEIFEFGGFYRKDVGNDVSMIGWKFQRF